MNSRQTQIHAVLVLLLGGLAFVGPLSGSAAEGGVNCNEYQCVQIEPQCDPDGQDAFCALIGCGSGSTCDDGEEHDCVENSAVLCTKN